MMRLQGYSIFIVLVVRHLGSVVTTLVVTLTLCIWTILTPMVRTFLMGQMAFKYIEICATSFQELNTLLDNSSNVALVGHANVDLGVVLQGVSAMLRLRSHEKPQGRNVRTVVSTEEVTWVADWSSEKMD